MRAVLNTGPCSRGKVRLRSFLRVHGPPFASLCTTASLVRRVASSYFLLPWRSNSHKVTRINHVPYDSLFARYPQLHWGFISRSHHLTACFIGHSSSSVCYASPCFVILYTYWQNFSSWLLHHGRNRKCKSANNVLKALSVFHVALYLRT